MKDLNTNASVSAFGAQDYNAFYNYKGSTISQISKGSMYTKNDDLQLGGTQ